MLQRIKSNRLIEKPNFYQNEFLAQLFAAGKPLLEIGISPVEGISIQTILEIMQSIAPDIELRPDRYGNDSLEGDATAEAMERLFGFKLKRVNLPRWNEEIQCYQGVHEASYKWQSEVDWVRTPYELEGKLKNVGYSQPGTNDNGELDEIRYELPPKIYTVTRIDDHGRSYHVAKVFRCQDAEEIVAKFESAVHKQTYFISTEEPNI